MRIFAIAGFAGLLIGSLAAQPGPQAVKTWSGIILDASCTDRSLVNLRSQPEAALATINGPQKPAEGSAAGISVSPQVVKAERAEAILPDTADHASRYPSASCALTADTKAFMLLLPDGTLLNLDEGGNTMAFEAFQDSAGGQAILNGKVGGMKPQATIAGIRSGDRLKARSVELHRPPQQNAPAK
jgi:hypothetical protein